jgi:flagellar biosynthesis regulator FlaF
VTRNAASGRGNAGSKPPLSNQEIVDYFNARVAALPMVATTRTPSGQILDWIPVSSQHPSGTIAKPPPSAPSVSQSGLKWVDFELSDSAVPRGPAGTVPILRKDFSRLSVQRSLKDYLSKPRISRKDRPRNAVDVPNPYGYFHAQATQTITSFGGDGYLNVWQPNLESSAYHSIAQVWLVNTDNQTQTVEAGWIVDPDRYGDQQTHFFTFFTTNNYTKSGNNIGGWDTDQKGWVQYASHPYPGALLIGTSQQGGAQYAMPIKYQWYEGNWWFQVVGIWIGYYPASLFMGNQSTFTTLGDHADSVQFGGEVFSSDTNPSTTNSQMGSGCFSEGGLGHACFLANLRYQSDRNGTMANLNGQGSAENPTLYDIQTYMQSRTTMGSYLLMGGPGTQRTKMSPSLATFGNQLSVGFVADNDTNELLVCSTPGPFQNTSWSGNTPVGQNSKLAASVAAFGARIFMAFVSSESSQELLICSSLDGLNWSPNTSVGQRSKTAPSLAVFNDQLWIAFVADNNSNEILVCSSPDGVNWAPNNTPVGQYSNAAPSLTVFQNALWLAFVANDSSNALLICTSADGQTWLGNSQIQGQYTKTAPSIVAFGNQLWVAFIANNSSNQILYCTSSNGRSWTTDLQVGQQSGMAPSLAVFSGQLCLTFVANNSSRELLMCTNDGVDGWSGNSLINQTSQCAPSLTVFNGELWLGFTADNSSNNLLVCSIGALPNFGPQWSGLNFAGNTPLGQTTKAAPSLLEFNGALWMAFVANNNTNDLLTCSSSDSLNWSATYPVGQASKTAPALAIFGHNLWMAFVADNNANELLVCSSTDGKHWLASTPIQGQYSKTAPSLVAFNNQLWVAFVANNSSNDLLVCSSSDGVHWSGDLQIQGQSSKAMPSLAVFNNRLWVAFQANDNTNQLWVCSSADGTHWSGNSPIQGQFSNTAPSLAVFEQQLNVAFVANRDPRVLLICSSADGISWNGNFII